MLFKGKVLKSGSDYYAAAMELMKRDEDPRCIRGATELFVAGAELNDRFCKMRLKEVLRTPRYLHALDSFCSKDLVESVMNILSLELAEAEYREICAKCRRGIFGGYAPKPINRSAAMNFQRKH